MAKAHWLDYVIFSVIMLISLATGIYFSLKPQSADDYLYGRRKMPLMPVSASLIVSYLSAVTMMGIPAEVYMYGIQYSVILLNGVGIWLAAITFVPLYHSLPVTTVYQYLNLRFNYKPLLILAYTLAPCTAFLFMGIVLYAPAAALESVIGFPTWINIIGVSVVCTIYTAIGGIKAVVWNDLFQALVMMAGLLTVIVAGVIKVGGITDVWYELEKRNRTTISTTPDPTLRVTLWYGLTSILAQWAIYSNQPAMMRFQAVPTIRISQYSMLLCSLGEFFINFMAVSAGAVVLAFYSKLGCDPLESKQIDSPNQILPYFLVDGIGIPGLPGLFLAAVVASSLSTISSIQNAMAAVFWKDIALPLIGPVSDMKEMLALKLVIVLSGIISTVIAFGAEYIGGTLVSMLLLVLSVTDAPPLGIFILGAAFTFPSGIAALIGCLSSMALCTGLHLGRYYSGVTWPEPPGINERCSTLLNNITNNFTSIKFGNKSNTGIYNIGSTLDATTAWNVFLISPYLYASIGIATTIIVALVLSLLPCLQHDKTVESKLLFPCVRRLVKSSRPVSEISIEVFEIETLCVTRQNI